MHVRIHVKLGVFSKDTLLCSGYWLWALRIFWGLQTCIALHCRKVKSTKWLKHKLRATLGGQ